MANGEAHVGPKMEHSPDSGNGAFADFKHFPRLFRAAFAGILLSAAECGVKAESGLEEQVVAQEEEEEAVSALDCENMEVVASALYCENAGPATFLRGFEDILVTEKVARELAEVRLPEFERLWSERQKGAEAIRNDTTSPDYWRRYQLAVKDRDDAKMMLAAEKAQKYIRGCYEKAKRDLPPEIVKERYRCRVQRTRDGTGTWEVTYIDP